MNKWLRSLALALLVIFIIVTPVFAQTYRFTVDESVVDAYFNSDGTLTLVYTYTFTNDPSASPIDYVDIGMPNGNFDLSSVSASVNGKSISDISRASAQNLTSGSDGITLALHGDAIQPGQTGTVTARVEGIKRVYYTYSKGETRDYASVRFSPNFFGSQFVQGFTHLKVSFHLPNGVTPDQPQYELQSSDWPGTQEPATYLDDEGRVTYTWESPQASAAQRYEFSAAFPASAIPQESLSTGFSFDPSILICICIGLLFVGIFGFAIYASTVAARKRKMQYLPPKIAIEGHGIKRGLTAVEAAILMEQPMDKILTMVLFGVIKKGAASVISKEPLEVKVADAKPEGLQPYESEFLDAFQVPAGKERQRAMQAVMVTLVKTVAEKMKGFSRKETIAYYDDINKRAWAQVQAAGTPEIKSQKYDEYMEWTMLGKDYENQTKEVFSSGPVFVPMWWGHFDPTYHAPSTPVSGGIPSGGQSGNVTVTLPSLPGADFAASMVSGVQNFAGNLVGDITSFTSGVTNKTNPPPPPPPPSSYRGGGGGGGHSCACACACAGCACACAGGGR